MTARRLNRPVILLHGWTMRGAIFDDLAARLGPDVRAPDLPGHGALRNGTASLDAAVATLDSEVAETGTEAIVVGWSLGAAVAWSWLERHGGQGIAGLVTVDMSPRPLNDSNWKLGLLGSNAERLRRTTREIRTDWPAAAQKIATTMFANKSGAPGLSRSQALAQVLSNDPVRMADYWDDMLAMDLRAAARGVTIPWRVAHGASSRVYPAETARWLADTSEAAHLVRFAHSGHSPHLEEPEAFARLVRDFDAELSSA
ncbi:alpha/beta hydrolase [Sulfitobacter sp. D35]|uniref:alpha/beta fold hydrolase n=1 Tax=Sulfitobacter sp. D35 TaxID=3083252 RepID=UPI00296ECFDB|nr:alpha/beta hydrolase [Sulfitobacter sp. D35]MDW4499201.1 alpha/beta hydrolase [Sulfitobacter sp. D35]